VLPRAARSLLIAGCRSRDLSVRAPSMRRRSGVRAAVRRTRRAAMEGPIAPLPRQGPRRRGELRGGGRGRTAGAPGSGTRRRGSSRRGCRGGAARARLVRGRGRQRALRQRCDERAPSRVHLEALGFAVQDATGIDFRDLASRRTSWSDRCSAARAVVRLHRVRPRASPGVSGVDWHPGKGVIGMCVVEGRDIGYDISELDADIAGTTREHWAALSDDERLGPHLRRVAAPAGEVRGRRGHPGRPRAVRPFQHGRLRRARRPGRSDRRACSPTRCAPAAECCDESSSG
jgi:hypothetical protein